MADGYEARITGYYRDQAAQSGLAATTTMPDEIVIESEVAAILRFADKAARESGIHRVLEVGCGNGHLAAEIDKAFGARFQYRGIDLTPEMIALARSRSLPCDFREGSILALDLEDGSIDLVISERVVINILDPEAQVAAIRELARVTRRGALLVLIEGFKEGLANLNRARADFLLDPIPEPSVNNWFTEERWARMLDAGFSELSDAELDGLAPTNFLSSHYFMTRFVHDAIRPEGGKVRNTEFARFFAHALPPVGDYSPLRIKYLRRS